MVRYSKGWGGFLFLLFLPTAFAGSSVTVNFEGSIVAGTCEIRVADSHIDFGSVKITAFSPGKAVVVKTLDAEIDCSANTTPSVTVTPAAGTVLLPGTAVFRGAASTSSGLGFMVRKNTPGGIPVSAFYDEAQALSATPTPLSPSDGKKTNTEQFALGLVQPPLTAATAGSVVAKITLNVQFN